MGASLLAMASAHPALMLTDLTLSRAGSLPQGAFGEPEVRATAQLPNHSHKKGDLRPLAVLPCAALDHQ
ncbi:hypothetical protein C1X64_02585 [Pseudomonas sp. GW456-E7]|nr:hypothetical protein C1X64_02585 [Pseudomonas sp. GW456-E7]